MRPRSLCKQVTLAVLAAAFLAAPARPQDEGAAPDGIIPWDLPEDSDGVLEPHEMDVRGLAQLLDSLCAPPPPIETVHVGTLDAATGDFIWGEDLWLPVQLDGPLTGVGDVAAAFDGVGIEDLQFDLDPAITGLGSIGLPASSVPAAKFKPAAGAKGKPGKDGAADDDRLRGHPGDKGTMHASVAAAKLALLFDVVNRPAGKAPLVVTVDGVTVQAGADSVDILVGPRSRHAFTVSCGKPSFTDKLGVSRPPLIGAFTLEALPVAMVYEPPGGSGCSQTWTQTHRVGTQIRTFRSKDSSAAAPVDTPFSRVGDYIALLNAAGGAAASSGNPYAVAAGTAAQTAATALQAGWGNSSTTETVSHTVTDTHEISFELAESVSVGTTEGLGPGQGDVYYLLIKPTFAWLVAGDAPSGRLYVTLTLLGYQGHAAVSAKALRSHVLALPAVEAQDQLLALNPLAPEYVAPLAVAHGGKKGGIGPFGNFAGPAPERLLPLASPLIVVAGGTNTFNVERTIQQSDLAEASDVRTTTTEEEGGFLSYVSKDVPQTGTRTLNVVGGRSELSSVSESVTVSVTLDTPSAEPLYLEAWYDRLFGTFAFKTFEPGTQELAGSVNDGGGLPKPATDVNVKLPDGRTLALKTDADGHFSIKPPAGLKGPVTIESGGARTRVDWNGTAVTDVVVRGEAPAPKAKKGGKQGKTSLPDPKTVPVTASEGTTAGAIRGKPGLGETGKMVAGPAVIERDPAMKGRLGRLVVKLTGDFNVADSRIDVAPAGTDKSATSKYGELSEELMPSLYDLTISGCRVNGIEVRSAHETRVRVGVLRVMVSDGTRVDLFEPGGKSAFKSFYGAKDMLLPPGRVEIAVAGLRDGIEIKDGQVAEF